LPVNLYGPFDNFHLENSHVIPAMIRKFLEAKEAGRSHVELWGDGSASREFLFVEDCARAIVLGLKNYDGPEPVNLGAHRETTIKELALTVKEIVGFSGEIRWDTTKPNGQPKRMLETSRAREAFDFTAQVELRDGLRKTIDWFLEHRREARL
jgi:GDP-L-fucose synthase